MARDQRDGRSRLKEGYCGSDLKDAGESNRRSLPWRFGRLCAAGDGIRSHGKDGAVEIRRHRGWRYAEVLGKATCVGLGQRGLLRESDIQARIALADGQFRKCGRKARLRARLGDTVPVLGRFDTDVAMASEAHDGFHAESGRRKKGQRGHQARQHSPNSCHKLERLLRPCAADLAQDTQVDYTRHFARGTKTLESRLRERSALEAQHGDCAGAAFLVTWAFSPIRARSYLTEAAVNVSRSTGAAASVESPT